MIISQKAISLAEAKKYVKDNPEVTAFMNKFSSLSDSDGEKMRKQLEDLGMIKLREEQIVKIIDLLPDNQSDLNKIFVDVSLEEDETNKILDVVKQYK